MCVRPSARHPKTAPPHLDVGSLFDISLLQPTPPEMLRVHDSACLPFRFTPRATIKGSDNHMDRGHAAATSAVELDRVTNSATSPSPTRNIARITQSIHAGHGVPALRFRCFRTHATSTRMTGGEQHKRSEQSKNLPSHVNTNSQGAEKHMLEDDLLAHRQMDPIQANRTDDRLAQAH